MPTLSYDEFAQFYLGRVGYELNRVDVDDDGRSEYWVDAETRQVVVCDRDLDGVLSLETEFFDLNADGYADMAFDWEEDGVNEWMHDADQNGMPDENLYALMHVASSSVSNAT